MEPDLVGDVPELVISSPTAEHALGGCVGSPAAETRTLVQVAEEPENPVDRFQQLEDPDEAQQGLMKNPEVQEEYPVQGAMDSRLGEPDQPPVSETDHPIRKLPRHQCEALYVADLHPSVIENVGLLYELFSRVGKLANNIRVIPNPKPAETAGGPPLCSAFVNFLAVEDACRAWQTLNYHVWMGVPMRIMFSNLDPASRYNQKANTIVTNLEESINSEILHHNFSEFGVVLSSKVELDPVGRSTGRGYIQFQDEDEALRAIEKMNNRMLRGKRVHVEPFMRRTVYWEAGNKNTIALNPAHRPPMEVDILSQVVKNGNGSHAIRFGSFECATGPHDIAAADTAVSFQSSVSAASASTSNTQGVKEDNPSEERRKNKRRTRAQRNKARNKAVFENKLKEFFLGNTANSQDSEAPWESSGPTEPWPPQPWSVEMLKAKLVNCPEDREAMLGETLSFLVSKQTKHFHSEVTNELKKLDIDEIERIMKMSEDDLYAKVDEVKLEICNRINNQAPFVPAPVTSSTVAAANDPTASVEVPVVPDFALPDFAVQVFGVPDYAVPVVPEFLETPELPGLGLGILSFLVPYPPAALQLNPLVQHFPHWVLNSTGSRRGTGFYHPRIEAREDSAHELYVSDEEIPDHADEDRCPRGVSAGMKVDR